METKHILRKKMLRIRREIPEELKREKSRELCRQILELPLYQNAEILYTFMPYKGEPDIFPITEDAWKQGKTVLVPKVYGDIMEFIRIFCLQDLSPGAWNIPEPVSDEIWKSKDPRNALMLVPGCAFTAAGDRMGYGRGYYDRYLQEFPVYTIGVGYAEQLLSDLPTEETDQKLKKILTV